MRDNFFHKSLGPVPNLGEGVEAWTGYHSSIRPTGLGLTLNLGKWLCVPYTSIKIHFRFVSVMNDTGLCVRFIRSYYDHHIEGHAGGGVSM